MFAKVGLDLDADLIEAAEVNRAKESDSLKGRPYLGV